MKKYTNKIVKTIPYIIIAVLVGITAVYASTTTSLTPAGPATNTMYSLTDIWNLSTGTVVSENNGVIDPTPSEVALSGKSLSDVYTVLSTEIAKLTNAKIAKDETAFGYTGTLYGDTDPAKVLTTATYAGTAVLGYQYGDSNQAYVLGTATGAGTALKNMWNGTSGIYTGGSQADGGADDFNNLGAPASGRYSGTWTACTSGADNYCGTGLASADAKDDSTGLIWSLPCNGVGCSSFSDTSPLSYTWNNSGGNNNSKTASQLCSAGVHGESGWFLPHEKQLLQGYINGAYGNLVDLAAYSCYYSATVVSHSTSVWYICLNNGRSNYATKTEPWGVRCVR